MDAKEVLARFRELGTEQNRKIYRRHGDSGAETFGVSHANLYAIRREIKRDQALADELWAVAIYEPQALACMISDPKSFDRSRLERWAREACDYAISDDLARYIVAKTRYALPLARKWVGMKSPAAQRTGWSTFGILALSGSEPDSVFIDLLPVIEREIHTAPNRTRQAMNSALIAFGGRSPALREAATSAARRIGPVSVDHGETYCKTPDAVPYIEKIWARKKAG